MPTSLEEAFNAASGEQAKSAPPPAAPSSKGMSLEDAFNAAPTQPSFGEKVGKAISPIVERVKERVRDFPKDVKPLVESAKRAGAKAADINRALSEQTQEQVFGPIADAFAGAYVDFQQQGRDYQKGQGNLETLKQGGQQLLDVIGMVNWWAPPVQNAVVEPIKAQIKTLGEKVSKGDKYTQHDFDALSDMFEAAYWTAFGGEGAAKPAAAKMGATTGARMALREMREVVGKAEEKPKPPAEKLQAVSEQIDKSMGFQKVNENMGAALKKIKPGAQTTVGQVIKGMIPDAQGYAKSFLEKLGEHVTEDMPVFFRTQRETHGLAGYFNPEENHIALQAGKSNLVHVAVHEAVHSVTVNMLNELVTRDIAEIEAERGVKLSSEERAGVAAKPRNATLRELDDIIKEARLRAAKAGRFQNMAKDLETIYALDPLRGEKIGPSPAWQGMKHMAPRYEFVAQLFSSAEFQEFLANSEKYASAGYKWKNILNQFSNLIARHLGLKGQEVQLLSRSMTVGEQLMKLHSEEKPPTSSILTVVGKLGDEVITKGDIDRATIVGKPDSPRLRAAERTMRISVEQLLRTLNPEGLGSRAKLAAATISRRITELEQKTAAWLHGSRTRSNFWRARPDLQREFLERAEKGETFKDPALQRMAEKYRAWAQQIYEQDMRNGHQYEARENYFSHIFEESPEDIAAYFNEHYGSKWGDPSFIKERSFDLYKEAIAAGFHPRFESPEDIMLARQHASDVAEMHGQILRDLEKFGLATKKVKGKEEFVKEIGPDGKVSWRVERTEGTTQPENTTRRRSPTGDVYWVDNQAFSVLKNAFDSYSLWGDRGGIGAGFRGMMGLKNAVIPIRLALSLFHPLHVTGIDIAAGWTRATADLLSGGNPVKFLGRVLQSSFNPLVEAMNIPLGKGGWRVVNAWKGKIKASELTGADAEALKILMETGVAPEMSSMYRTNARQNFANALRDTMASFRNMRPGGVAGGLTRATWHLPWATISAMSKPIFEQWIPALKAMSAIRDAKALLERNPELANNEAARLLQMRRIGKSIDNRYGEMAYNKLFWQRWMKDVAVLDTLSLGWQLGFLREYGGGVMDLGQFARKGDKLARIRKGDLDKPIFVGAYTALGAGVAGLMSWANTGEYPTGMDWINPRTGNKNPDGSDERVTTMFYSREFAALYKHMQNEGTVSGVKDLVLNKGSGMFGLMHEWATGVNSFGKEIRDPDGDAFQKVEQTLAYTLSDLEPISMKSIEEHVSEEPMKQGTMSVLGFTPAPKYLTESKTVAHIKRAFQDYATPRKQPYEMALRSEDYTKLRKAYQSGDEKYPEMLDHMIERYHMESANEIRRLVRSLNSPLPPEVRMFARLDWMQQTKILDEATDEERQLLLPHSNKEHVRSRWVPPEQRGE